jgi:pimeloyl-ACP methyl ester carboxylesterase
MVCAEEEKVMWRLSSLFKLGVALLALCALAGCVPPNPQPAAEQPGAISVDELLANLDTLQGSAARNLSPRGLTVFTTPGGVALSLQDLSSYLNAIKTDLAGYVKARTGGKPYLVLPVKLSWGSGSAAESGMMWVPFTWGRRLDAPVISYQHGTQVYRQCAPSRFDANPLSVLASPDPTGALQSYVECVAAALMASAGYIVVMPDYAGFGDSPVVHPYVHRSLGTSVAGILGAAKTALKGVVRPTAKTFLTGYSEGGYATMAGAAALQGLPYAVAAVVPCDGPYDLSGTMRIQMLTQAVKVPSYLLYSVSGYAEAGEIASLDGLLTGGFAGYVTAPNMFDGNHTNAEISALPLPVTPSLMLVDGAANARLQPGGDVYQALVRNDGWRDLAGTPAAICFIHCPDDDVVPPLNAVAAAAALPPAQFPNVAVVPVAAVPFVSQALGSTHVAAFPTAMLAAFTVIETVNRGY